MGKVVTEKPKELHLAEVVRHRDQKIMLPDGLSIEDAIGILYRLQQHEEQTVEISEEIDTFPWDGAHALKLAIEETWGFSFARPTGWWGERPPELKSIPAGVDSTVLVPWGALALPVINCTINTGMAAKGERIIFKLTATVQRKYEKDVRALFDLVRAKLRSNSILRGKPFRIRFNDDRGQKLPIPDVRFMEVAGTQETDLILPRSIEAAIADNIYTPIERADDLTALGESLKRTVVLAGTYGTGKTLCANVTAAKAAENGWTFILCERAEEFSATVSFAKQYARAVVFCEDIDRVAAGQRDVEMDDILNTIDGIEAKNPGMEVMVVLTTNNIESINDAFMRPGRFDAVIELTLPDADATERLIRRYAGDALPNSEDVMRAAEHLKGNIPATVAETVKRAKLSAVRLLPPGIKEVTISSQAMLNAAQAMEMQLRLLNRKEEEELSEREKAAQITANGLGQLADAITTAASKNGRNGKNGKRLEPEHADHRLPAHAAGAGD